MLNKINETSALNRIKKKTLCYWVWCGAGLFTYNWKYQSLPGTKLPLTAGPLLSIN